jgi:hypothetical protein
VIALRVDGMGIVGPGLDGTEELHAVVTGTAPYRARETRLDVPGILSPRERRRASPSVRLALAAASAAVRDAGARPEELAMVFGSSLGDATILNSLLETLAEPARLVSPTLFHNSVHNSALAYWSIGTGSRHPGTSLAARDATFGIALLKSATQVAAAGRTVLLVVYDHPLPDPLHAARPLIAPFAAALVLSSPEASDGPPLGVALPAEPAREPTAPRTQELGALWAGNPAARALPVLEALVLERAATLDVAYGRRCLRVTIGVRS